MGASGGLAIHALVFDFDGLIVDTEGPDFHAWAEIYREHGHVLPLERWVQQIGTLDTVFDAHAELERLTGLALDRDRLRARRRARSAEMIRQEPLRPGVLAYLDRAAELGLHLGVASSSPRDWVHGHLKRLGLFSRFEAICCGDEVERTKPDPAVYLGALARLGVQPEAAIALEDSANGALAAKRAGLYCVAVPHALTIETGIVADLVLPALDQLSLDDLLRHVTSTGAE